MYASAQRHHDYAAQCRFLARTAAVTLFAIWAAYVVAEMIRSHHAPLAPETYLQGIVLAVVFAGYAIGWRWELVGGLMAIVATGAFFVVEALTVSMPRDPNMAWFAVPGMLYLLARHYDHVSDRPAT